MKDTEAFKRWFIHNYKIMSYQEFKILHFEFKWGVYLEFFDSVGIVIQLEHDNDPHDLSDVFLYYINGDMTEKYWRTRTEAQKEAIKKAFEILETQLKDNG